MLPGGESTTQLRLLASSGLSRADRAPDPRRRAGARDLRRADPAGASVTDPEQKSLGLLDVTVARNAWGRQLDSFEATSDRRGVPLVFIRAPRIRAVGPGVEVLDTFGGEPVLVRQGNVVGATFHPELTGDPTVARLAFEAKRFLPQRGMSSAELWLVRHGETVGGSSTRLYGSTDLALSDVGRRQMECVRAAVADVVFDRVITSPLQRSREAAAIVHPRPEPAAAVIDAVHRDRLRRLGRSHRRRGRGEVPGRARSVAQRRPRLGIPRRRDPQRLPCSRQRRDRRASGGRRRPLAPGPAQGRRQDHRRHAARRDARGLRGAPVRARESPSARARERELAGGRSVRGGSPRRASPAGEPLNRRDGAQSSGISDSQCASTTCARRSRGTCLLVRPSFRREV